MFFKAIIESVTFLQVHINLKNDFFVDRIITIGCFCVKADVVSTCPGSSVGRALGF